MFSNVVVGVDGQDGGRDAIALAQVLLARDGKLTLAYVYRGDPYVYGGASAAYAAAEAQAAHELLERERSEAGIEGELRWQGSTSPGRGLHELCEDAGADASNRPPFVPPTPLAVDMNVIPGLGCISG
jgi:nucleotide-binding universal stress UspA family protein